jgi:PEGA domain
MKPVAFLRCLACGLVFAAGFTQAAPDCASSANEPARVGLVSPGRQSLGEGMALFDAHNLPMAERALQTALFLGLSDGQERASAHKYLALVYCSNSEWARCEAAFDAAFEARPSFQLEAREFAEGPWRDAYLRSLARSTRLCGHTGAGPHRPAPAPAPAQPVGFALKSSVIVGVDALVPTTALRSPRPSAAALPFEPSPLQFGNNVRLRVTPWAYVQVDGKRLGVTPALTQFKLTPGPHTIELHNPGFDTLRQVVRMPQDAPVLIAHDFEAR